MELIIRKGRGVGRSEKRGKEKTNETVNAGERIEVTFSRKETHKFRETNYKCDCQGKGKMNPKRKVKKRGLSQSIISRDVEKILALPSAMDCSLAVEGR